MNNKDMKYITTVEQNGANWEIYTQQDKDDKKYIDIWVKREDLGIMDFVIGVINDDDWRDMSTGPIIDFINSTEGDPRYE